MVMAASERSDPRAARRLVPGIQEGSAQGNKEIGYAVGHVKEPEGGDQREKTDTKRHLRHVPPLILG